MEVGCRHQPGVSPGPDPAPHVECGPASGDDAEHSLVGHVPPVAPLTEAAGMKGGGGAKQAKIPLLLLLPQKTPLTEARPDNERVRQSSV